MEAYFASAPAAVISPVIWRGAETGSTGTSHQADTLKPARKRKSRAEKDVTGEPEPQPATTTEPTGRTQVTKKKTRKTKRQVPPSRNQRVLISGTDPERVNYAEICKKLKSGVDLDTLGDKVTEMHRTKSSAVALAVGKDESGAQAAEKLRVTVEAVLGSDAKV